MAATLFEKICSGEIPADIVYQDEQCAVSYTHLTLPTTPYV